MISKIFLFPYTPLSPQVAKAAPLSLPTLNPSQP